MSEFFKTGAEGFQERMKRETAREEMFKRHKFRFFIKPDQEKTIIFLDSEGVWIDEHSFRHNGKWGNYLTCLKDKQATCPMCDSGKDKGGYSVYTCFYTIIDTSEFVKKDGTKGKNTKMLLAVKAKSSLKQIEDIKKKGSLTGQKFTVKRYSDKEPSIGALFIPDGAMDLSKVTDKEQITPFNYADILSHPTDEELAYYGFKVDVPMGSKHDVEDLVPETDDGKSTVNSIFD